MRLFRLGSPAVLITFLLSPAVCRAAASTPAPPADTALLTLSAEPSSSLRVAARWDRIVEARYNVHRRYGEVFEYSPAEPVRTYSAAEFRSFLPKKAVGVGDLWPLEGASLEPILHQFHRRATTRLRYGSPGAFACLRALSQRYAEIVFRFHGEIDLLPGEIYLTLSQFTGHLLIDRQTERVVQFVLEVPDRNTNADINAFRFADIVYIPRMDLRGGDASVRDGVAWADAISEDDAKRRLALSFYRFAEIDWTGLESAIARAEREQKPLHVLLLFGTLDDESC